MRIITARYLLPSEGSHDAGRIDVAEFLGRFKVIYGHSIKDRFDLFDRSALGHFGSIRTIETDPWISKALGAIGRAILADKAEAANRHYATTDNLPLPFDGATVNRRRSSAVRSAALFQKFKDYTDEAETGGTSMGQRVGRSII